MSLPQEQFKWNEWVSAGEEEARDVGGGRYQAEDGRDSRDIAFIVSQTAICLTDREGDARQEGRERMGKERVHVPGRARHLSPGIVAAFLTIDSSVPRSGAPPPLPHLTVCVPSFRTIPYPLKALMMSNTGE